MLRSRIIAPCMLPKLDLKAPVRLTPRVLCSSRIPSAVGGSLIRDTDRRTYREPHHRQRRASTAGADGGLDQYMAV